MIYIRRALEFCLLIYTPLCSSLLVSSPLHRNLDFMASPQFFATTKGSRSSLVFSFPNPVADAISCPLKMENKQGAGGTQDSSIMKPEQRPRSRVRSDLLTRRLKNRERQRRYRARKRLEAETKNSVVVQETRAVQAAELQPNGNYSNFPTQPNGNYSNFVTRIYCNRDWKKDARRAHVSKHQQMNGTIEPSPSLTSVTEVAEPMLQREFHSGSSSVVNNETPRIVLGRRNWKAEARRKKN